MVPKSLVLHPLCLSIFSRLKVYKGHFFAHFFDKISYKFDEMRDDLFFI